MNAEQAILSCMLSDIVSAKEASARLVEDDFSEANNRRVFAAIKNNIENKITPDIITVTKQCKDLALYITDLSSIIASTNNYQEYISIIIEDSCIKKLKLEISRVPDMPTTDDIIDFMSKEIEETERRTMSVDDFSTDATVTRTIDALQERIAGKSPGIETPLTNLTRCTGGWQPSDLIIIAARPSIGKTAFALACMKKAIEDNKAVVFFSLEMSRERIMDRLILSYSNVDALNYKVGKLNDDEKRRVFLSADTLRLKRIIINDKGSIGLAEIEAFAMSRRREGNCDMVIVDYIQLMKSRQEKGKTRDGELAEISRGLKMMARELNIPVIVLSQLNRQVEQRQNKRPMLSDLRESGAIEQDADIVLMMYRAAYYGELTVNIDGRDEPSRGIGEINISKHRNGEVGMELFSHNESMTRIYPYARVPDFSPNINFNERNEVF